MPEIHRELRARFSYGANVVPVGTRRVNLNQALAVELAQQRGVGVVQSRRRSRPERPPRAPEPAASKRRSRPGPRRRAALRAPPRPRSRRNSRSRLLALARAAAAQGDYGAAINHTYAALLRKLDSQSLIEIRRSRTNGDYVRAVGKASPELSVDLQHVASQVEGVQFGGQDRPRSSGSMRSTRACSPCWAARSYGSLLSASPRTRLVYGTRRRSVLRVPRRSRRCWRGDEQAARPAARGARKTRTFARTIAQGVRLARLLSWVKSDGATLIVAGGTPPRVRDRHPHRRSRAARRAHQSRSSRIAEDLDSNSEVPAGARLGRDESEVVALARARRRSVHRIPLHEGL